jgi:hypothetical protein
VRVDQQRRFDAPLQQPLEQVRDLLAGTWWPHPFPARMHQPEKTNQAMGPRP